MKNRVSPLVVYDRIPHQGSIGETELAIASGCQSLAEVRENLKTLVKKGWIVQDITQSNHWQRVIKQLTEEQLIEEGKTSPIDPVVLAATKSLSVVQTRNDLNQLVKQGRFKLERGQYYVCA